MIKRLIPVIILFLTLSMTAFAENEPQNMPPEVSEGAEEQRMPPMGEKGNEPSDRQNGANPSSPPEINDGNDNQPNSEQKTAQNENAEMPKAEAENAGNENKENVNKENENPFENMPRGGPDWQNGGNTNSEESEEEEGFFKKYFTPIVSMILLLGAFVFVSLYKRKKY